MSGLIPNPGQIWLCVQPVDLRRGIDGLSTLVSQVLGQSPCAGSAFVFRNAAGNRIKVNAQRHHVDVNLPMSYAPAFQSGNGNSSSIRLLGQVGSFSKVSFSQAAESRPLSLAVPSRV